MRRVNQKRKSFAVNTNKQYVYLNVRISLRWLGVQDVGKKEVTKNWRYLYESKAFKIIYVSLSLVK